MTTPLRYTDKFLNALMYPHKSTHRAELFYGGGKVGEFQFSTGVVNADRSSVVRRSFSGVVDPRQIPKSVSDYFTPYGAQVKIYRGVEYNDNSREEYPIFFGRVESVDFGREGIDIRCADRSADVVDSRFETPRVSPRGQEIRNVMRDLILEAVPGATVDIITTNNALVTVPIVWDRERADALDLLATSIGAEWYQRPDGNFRIAPMPSVIPAPVAVWIVNSGDDGVAMERITHLDRATVYNSVVVNGEPVDSTPSVYARSRDMNPTSPTRWGGPFGKVPYFFSSSLITTTAQAQSTADQLLGLAIAGTNSISVTCVCNPKLMLADVIQVVTSQPGFDTYYYTQSMTIPVEPETPMTLTGNVVIQSLS